MSAPMLNILQGRYKNRKIKLPEKIHGHSSVTPQKIKESVFQIAFNLINSPEETIFVDCFCGSGQMAFEALSRNYNRVFSYDIDSERIQNARQWIEKNTNPDDHNLIRIEKKDSLRFSFYEDLKSNFINSPEKKANTLIVFADPPYDLPYKSKKIPDLFFDFFLKAELFCNLILIFQTNKHSVYQSDEISKLIENHENLDFFKIYEYSSNRLVVMERKFNNDD